MTQVRRRNRIATSASLSYGQLGAMSHYFT